MKSLNIKIFISPLFLFSLGTFASASPYLYTHLSFFNSYPMYETSYAWIYVYITGITSFAFGASLIGLRFRYTLKDFNISPTNRIVKACFLSLNIILILLIYQSLTLYGGIPLLLLAAGELNANEINELQGASGGILGLLLLLTFAAIAFTPILNANGKIHLTLKTMFYALLFFSMIFTGKRQILFYAFFYLISFYIMYYKVTFNLDAFRRIARLIPIGLLIIVVIFWMIAVMRTGTNGGIFYPIAHYFSLPFINNIHMLNLTGLMHTRHFLSIFEIAVPTLFRHLYDLDVVVTQPQLEMTISGGLYGRVFWAYGILGVSLYCLLLGIVLQTIYRLAHRYKFFLFIYPFNVWPLLMVSTYDHFVNAMMYLIPMTLLLIMRLFYTGFQKL
jgi:oligosaccharide repeat unit polymerase